jgi:heme-degrading monooxygenase HmoA
MSQITTLTFFRYNTFLNRAWAFGMMQFAHPPLSKVKGQTTYKLMGSGKDGFNPFPDWSVYALLQIWENEDAANEFFENSELMKQYKSKSSEQYTLYLKNIKSNGSWAGINPFKKSDTLSEDIPFIAVITRATIKKRLLFKFWKYVPTSQKPLEGNKGLIFTKGIGEVPFTQMATFSIWRDKDSLMKFAYGSEEHKKAILDTKRLDWYKEELFSRFQPYKSKGNWSEIETLPF